MKNKKIKMSYEPEADVLRIEASKKRIEYATEIGDVVVHSSMDGTPVYFEILNAPKFLKRAATVIKPRQKRLLAHVF